MPIDPREQLAIFLQDVKDNPDDDTPRLVLADWLQDQGDPRGELISLSLQRHHLPEDDPGHDELRLQQRWLLRRHAFDWLGDLIDVVSSWTFERGFLHVEARAERFLTPQVKSLLETDLFLWVEALRLTDLRRGQLTWFRAPPPQRLVPHLDLSHNNLHVGDLADLLQAEALSQLRGLNLSRSRIGPPGISALVQCPSLCGLRSLHLAGNHLNDVTARWLAECPHYPRLQSLDLRGCSILPDTVELLRARFGDGLRIGPMR